MIRRRWRQRQLRRWRALSWEQRRDLNAEGKGWASHRWPYRWTPWVPRGMKPDPHPPPLPLEVTITADTSELQRVMREAGESMRRVGSTTGPHPKRTP